MKLGLFTTLLAIIAVWAVACGTDQQIMLPGANPDADSDTDADTDGDSDSDADSEYVIDTENMPEGCGDGELADNEACDDGNHDNNDGCTGDCLFVEEGWSCVPPGQPCHRMALCGDGAELLPEMCDDGNTEAGDGCSPTCKIEIGWKCDDASPNDCTHTTCGDGNIEGAEGCDDGNTLPFDGCDANCQREPNCSAGACTSECGDGLVLGDEACDDGNAIDGDGCSSTCQEEEGFTCNEDIQLGDSMEVPVIYKDFVDGGHSDFAQFEMTQAEKEAGGCKVQSTGMVLDTLSDAGKPVFDEGYGDPTVGTNPDECNDVASASSFDAWYSHTPEDAAVIPSTLVLWQNDAGDYVNRWLEDGTPWSRILDFEPEEPDYQALWCGSDGQNTTCSGQCAQGEAFDSTSMICSYPCEPWAEEIGGMTCAIRYDRLSAPEEFDGNPVFFPIDGQGIDNNTYVAKVADPVYEGMWITEETFLDENNVSTPSGYTFYHNFFFTSEVRFWFKYDANADQRFEFVGDDDVWVFVNKRLAVDLGGIHVPVEGGFTLQSLESSHNLENGQVYEISVFQAERQKDGSSYKLTLSGFDTARSDCVPDCGDGIVSLGEECDDAVNDGGYGECAPGCVLDAYCGDNIVQEDQGEDCDDGNFRNGDDCPSSCRQIVAE